MRPKSSYKIKNSYWYRQQKRWPPEKIRARLLEKGYYLVDIARLLNIKTENFVSFVIQGRGRSKRVEECIANILGVPREEIFGPVRKKQAKDEGGNHEGT